MQLKDKFVNKLNTLARKLDKPLTFDYIIEYLKANENETYVDEEGKNVYIKVFDYWVQVIYKKDMYQLSFYVAINFEFEMDYECMARAMNACNCQNWGGKVLVTSRPSFDDNGNPLPDELMVVCTCEMECKYQYDFVQYANYWPCVPAEMADQIKKWYNQYYVEKHSPLRTQEQTKANKIGFTGGDDTEEPKAADDSKPKNKIGFV